MLEDRTTISKLSEKSRTLKVRKPRSESQIPEVESRTPNMRPWTSFQRSGTLFRGGPLSPELHRRTIKSGTPFRGGPLKADYDISKVWNSLEADYDISKVRNLEADRDFEGPELEADRRSERSGPSYFEGLDLPIRSGPGPDLRLSDTVHGFLEAY
ncbi:hypothetical protein RCL_jg3896.t3 [Rhizophagus clarus]|uniref:Uncharacterized protein n=1 Tax=Rhizophagus clarus TaxID=94130 RepID=A0A8H3QAG0_9GLOM|nr:hypothetical protein RCL_jg3896.t3 [Rhizophagus clarus]